MTEDDGRRDVVIPDQLENSCLVLDVVPVTAGGDPEYDVLAADRGDAEHLRVDAADHPAYTLDAVAENGLGPGQHVGRRRLHDLQVLAGVRDGVDRATALGALARHQGPDVDD